MCRLLSAMYSCTIDTLLSRVSMVALEERLCQSIESDISLVDFQKNLIETDVMPFI